MGHLLQYHNEAREGRWEPPFGPGECGIATKNVHKYTEEDVFGHTCWLVIGRKLPDGQPLYFLGSRFTVESLREDEDLHPDYTHRALGDGESFLIPLVGDWFEEHYLEKRRYSHGFHFVYDDELIDNFERVVREEHQG